MIKRTAPVRTCRPGDTCEEEHMALPKRTVWINVVPPNVLGVYSTEEKAADAKSELDDDLYMRCDTWVWEIDGDEIEDE